VLLEFLRIIRLHVDQWRADHSAGCGGVFLWKQIGTPSIHLPQTHAIIRLMRLLCDYAPEKDHFC